jgi:CubicO group peptidase (beta-lactamase class C family)
MNGIVERVSGQSLAHLCRAQIFAPLGMDATPWSRGPLVSSGPRRLRSAQGTFELNESSAQGLVYERTRR